MPSMQLHQHVSQAAQASRLRLQSARVPIASAAIRASRCQRQILRYSRSNGELSPDAAKQRQNSSNVADSCSSPRVPRWQRLNPDTGSTNIGTGHAGRHRFDDIRASFTGNWGVYIDDPTFRWDGKRCATPDRIVRDLRCPAAPDEVLINPSGSSRSAARRTSKPASAARSCGPAPSAPRCGRARPSASTPISCAISVITSPATMPRSAAAEFGATSVTTTPETSVPMPNFLRASSSSSPTVMPSAVAVATGPPVLFRGRAILAPRRASRRPRGGRA